MVVFVGDESPVPPARMAARQVVLLTPSKSTHPRQLLFYKHIAPITHFRINTYNFRVSVDYKAFTQTLNPSESTLIKNMGGGAWDWDL